MESTIDLKGSRWIGNVPSKTNFKKGELHLSSNGNLVRDIQDPDFAQKLDKRMEYTVKCKKGDEYFPNGADQLANRWKYSNPQNTVNITNWRGKTYSHTATRHSERSDRAAPIRRDASVYERNWNRFMEITGCDPYYIDEYLHLVITGSFEEGGEGMGGVSRTQTVLQVNLDNVIPDMRILKGKSKDSFPTNSDYLDYRALCTLCLIFLYKNKNLPNHNYRSLKMKVINALKIRVNNAIIEKIGANYEYWRNYVNFNVESSQPGTIKKWELDARIERLREKAKIKEAKNEKEAINDGEISSIVTVEGKIASGAP